MYLLSLHNSIAPYRNKFFVHIWNNLICFVNIYFQLNILKTLSVKLKKVIWKWGKVTKLSLRSCHSLLMNWINWETVSVSEAEDNIIIYILKHIFMFFCLAKKHTYQKLLVNFSRSSPRHRPNSFLNEWES